MGIRVIDLPLVLAGPIVRRVEPTAAAVWVALSEPRSVQLDVFLGTVHGGSGPHFSGPPPLFSGEAPTLRVGEHLHVVVVNAAAPDGITLLPGQIYSYMLTFRGGPPGAHFDLLEAGLLEDHHDPPAHLALGYAPGILPSFSMPPEDLNDLRLVHASCRMLHGLGRDGLASLDDLIADRRDAALERPHQLFLTGDQIYADDVAMCALPLITDLGAQILGTERDAQDELIPLERLPLGGGMFPADQRHFPTPLRQRPIYEQAMFTSHEAESHLFSFGEYCAMYLMGWSTATWATVTEAGEKKYSLATEEDVFDRTLDLDAPTRPLLTRLEGEELEEKRTLFRRQLRQVRRFLETLPAARRALANVPVWMMFDDHDVTDDWNLTRLWRDQVLSTPLGRAIVRNAMLAYALFQDWGNDPSRYTRLPHSQILDQAAGLFPEGEQGPAEPEAGELEGLFGLDAGPSPGVPWHYTVRGPHHQVLVLDTRTRRSYASFHSPPGLVSKEALEEQIPEGPLPAGVEVLLVVSATSVLDIQLVADLVQPLANRVFDVVRAFDREKSPGAAQKDPEPWAFEPFAFEALLKRLHPYRRVVFLSGEIHLAFAAEMTYWKALSPASGSPVVNADGTVTYTPAPGFAGLDSFSYTITDDAGVSDSATVVVAVNPPPPAVPGLPQANDDVAMTQQETPVTIAVLSNDSGTEIEVTATSEPDGGAEVSFTDDSVTYTPAESFSGLDSFTYTVTDDSGAPDSATVVVAVDAPPPSPIGAQANDDAATTAQDTPVNIPVLANDSGVGIEVTAVAPVQLIPVARFVQLTSSPLKKEESDFRFTGNTPLAQLLFNDVGFPAERLIWEGNQPEPVTVPDNLVPFNYRFRLGQDPVLLPTVGWPPGTTTSRPPSFAWRYRLVADQRPDDGSPEARPVAVQPTPLPADVDLAAPEEGYVRTAARHAEALRKIAARRVSFAANVGVVRFRLANDSLSVRHEVLSVHPEAAVPNEPEVFLLHEASLDLPGPEEEAPVLRGGA